ncbi:MAG: hypothetical protein IPK22_15295 [Verrucomicrobiaceae bacterium]|nr:hypothetical protein [Verrucomicrobiaceae bacterium]
MFILIQRLFGVLIVAAFTALVANGLARLFVLPDLGVAKENLPTYALIVACALGALTGWLRWRHYMKADQRAAQPGPPPLPTTGPSKGFVWALVLMIGIPLLYTVAKDQWKKMGQSKQPGNSAFHSANLLLMGKSKGIAHGNTPEAKVLAEVFSQTLKEARKMGVESRKSPAIVTLTGGEFLTYCHLTPESCVFMVHVPDLRKFAPDAKDFIAEAAWRTGLAITREDLPSLRNLCIGIRGVMLYDRAIYGVSGNAAGATTLHRTEVKGDSEAESVLQRYFAPPAPSPTAVNAKATSTK